MIIDFFKSAIARSITNPIKPTPRPKHILQKPWSKYNLNPTQISQLERQGFLPRMEKRPRPSDTNRKINPPNEIELTFLGTSAGKPTIQRNPSSLALRLDGQIWMFDCGEATTHQIMRSNLKPSNVTKIFITHLHGDHVLGLISFLSHIGDRVETDLASKNQHPFSDPSSVVEIYGPAGLREFVRSNLRLTRTHSLLKIKVNELLRRSRDRVYPPSLSHPGDGFSRLWHTEVLGEDIWSDEKGLWKDVVQTDECGVSVSAAPIQHTIDCVGYYLNEANRREKFDMVKLKPILEQHADEIKLLGFKVLPAILSQLEKTRKPISFSTGVTIYPPNLSVRGRRIMILGDTCDPGAMVSLIDQHNQHHPLDLLIHEATGTSVPEYDDEEGEKAQGESQVAKKMRERGHSTSFMAGLFARRVNAARLILNHLGGKFPAPQGNICPSKGFPNSDSSGNVSSTIDSHNGLKENHAVLWKRFEELDHCRQTKIKEDLKWLKAVEEDALAGWNSADGDPSAWQPKAESSNTITEQGSSPSLQVSIAYDFLQIKVTRTDLKS